jgi:tetratricopeptide (TPR) repeat protein
MAQTPAETAQSLNTQGNRVSEAGSYQEAQRLYQESIKIWRSLGPQFEGHTAGTLLNLAVALAGDGQRQEATKVLEEALVLHRRALGVTHHHTLSNMNLLATNYLMLGERIVPNRSLRRRCHRTRAVSRRHPDRPHLEGLSI